jgi:hypothetical protein
MMKKEIETYFYLDGLTIVVEDLKNENNDLKKELANTNNELRKLRRLILSVFLLFLLAISMVIMAVFLI